MAEHVGEAPANGQEHRHGEEVGERDPAYGAELGGKLALELRQDQLHDARIELTHEGADRDGADHQPGIAGAFGDEAGGRWLPAAENSAYGGKRGRPGCSYVHCCPCAAPWPSTRPA